MKCPNCNRGLAFPPGHDKTTCKCGIKVTRTDAEKSGKNEEKPTGAIPASATGAAGDPPAAAHASEEQKPGASPVKRRDVLV